MRRAVLLGLLGSTLLGCAAEPPQVQHDQSYLLEWIGERPLVDRSHLTMTLGEDGRAYGNAGCNHWFAPYAQEGEKFHFGIVGSTRRVCWSPCGPTGARSSPTSSTRPAPRGPSASR